MPAGTYSTRLRWWQCVRTVDALGQPTERFRSNGYLWASIDIESPTRQQQYGGQHSGADADIRIRQFPSVSALDRLEDAGDIWVIESISRGTNELVCRCSRFDALEDWKQVGFLYDGGGSIGGAS